MPTHLIPPHGGKMASIMVMPDSRAGLHAQSRDWPSWDLTPRQLCDLELLLNGGFSPLTGFMGRADYEAVCSKMRLADGTLWPIPATLDLPEHLVQGLAPGSRLALRDPEGVMLAALNVEDVWQPDRRVEAEAVFGTTNREHPGVGFLMDSTHPYYVGGRLEGLQLPAHYDFRSLRFTPAELRSEFARLGWRRVVAFQTRNPMHRAHHELTLRAAREV
ncbi:MAG: adenylyltransferase, partial [Acidobacteriota bacterium]